VSAEVRQSRFDRHIKKYPMNHAHPKHAQPDHPILEPISQRWSPYAYDPTRTVDSEKLRSALEAARWAASSYNEQPWTFLLARRENQEAFATMLECLTEANQAWAKNASVLLLTVAARTFARNGKPNRVAEHDIGLAAASFAIQATALGLDVHQMAGINIAKIRQTYGVPDGYDPLTAIAVGYALPPEQIDDAQAREKDTTPRQRKSFAEIVFAGKWGESAKL
jgi:nitroreductase